MTNFAIGRISVKSPGDRLVIVMKVNYYEMEDDVDFKGRWYLNGLIDANGIELDSRYFCNGLPIDIGPPAMVMSYDEDNIIETAFPLNVSLRRKGVPLDFTYADFDMPIVTTIVADVLATVARADFQRIPVNVSGRKGQYEILNVTSRIDCIDAARSEIQWYSEEDDPDMAGEPEMITELVIDSKRARKSHILRPKGWEMVIIVSELVKSTLENSKVSGVRFRLVSS